MCYMIQHLTGSSLEPKPSPEVWSVNFVGGQMVKSRQDIPNSLSFYTPVVIRKQVRATIAVPHLAGGSQISRHSRRQIASILSGHSLDDSTWYQFSSWCTPDWLPPHVLMKSENLMKKWDKVEKCQTKDASLIHVTYLGKHLRNPGAFQGTETRAHVPGITACISPG